MRKSITLVELLIAVTLMGIVILGAVAFHLAGEKFLISSETKARVLNDLSFVLQHLQKNILLGTGDLTSRGINVPAAGILSIRQDIDAVGNQNYTPADYSDDRTVRYKFGIVPDQNSVMFSDDNGVSWENLTLSFIDLTGDGWPFSIVLNPNDGGVEITNLALRLDPASAKNDSTNPQVTTIDTDVSPDRTIYFYSLAHTW